MGFLAGLALGFILGILALLAFQRLVRARSPYTAPTPPTDARSDLERLLGTLPAAPSQGGPNLDSLRQQLRARILHNPEVESRLIAAERERNPGASEPELYRAAIARLDRDNR
jgi:hypothetical protein